MWILNWLVGSRLGRIVGYVLAAIGTFLAIFTLGKRDAKKSQEIKDLKEYQKTMERAHETPHNTDRDAALERLRKSGHVRDSD